MGTRWHKFCFTRSFIAAAESEGVIRILTNHLLNLVINDIRKWHIEDDFHIGINISPIHLQDDNFVRDLECFKENLPSNFIPVIEVTERSLITDMGKSIASLSKLREKGFKVAIDDFGTGYCSLSVLQALPLDYLKIDKCFTNTISMALNNTTILETIINLGNQLQLITIAEGVASYEQYEFFASKNVAIIQGYYYSPLCPVNYLQIGY